MSRDDRSAPRARRLAAAAALERVVNSYLRETALGVPLPALHVDGLPPGARLVALPHTGRRVAVVVTWISPTGHHRYGDGCWVAVPDGSRWRPAAIEEVAELVLYELAATDPDPDRRTRRHEALLAQVTNSLATTARYLEHRLAEPPMAHLSFVDAEQRLLLGHPFHPTPKSVEGFRPDDFDRYAPEMGAAFPLHWFAVAAAAVAEATVEPGPLLPVPAEVATTVDLPSGWSLLPSHPWQATQLAELPEVATLIDAGLLTPLGPLGPPVYPTSSVRTVWDPVGGRFLKLPLDVRITNFVRINPSEHLRRSLDVSALLPLVLPMVRLGGCTVLRERGWRALRPPLADPEVTERIMARTAVLVREAPEVTGPCPPLVAATLLEPSPHTGRPPLADYLQRAAEASASPVTKPFVARWLRRYLELTLAPLVRLLAESGISLEAHPQNSLVAFEEGWPVHAYIRDLEGASVDRDHPHVEHYLCRVPSESPTWYSREETWDRLAYYVVVNHIGQLVATLAWSLDRDEAELWAEVRACLDAVAETFDHRGAGLVRALATRPELPAKANFRSRFEERGEAPLYVGIPNPLRECAWTRTVT